MLKLITTDHYQMLKEQIEDLRAERNALAVRAEELLERLLRKEAVPPTAAQQRQSDIAEMEDFVKKMDIFDDQAGGDTEDSVALIERIDKENKNNVSEFVQ